jgi:hypothetical protein
MNIFGDWFAFCDICGKRCYASTMIKLAPETGRGGLLVCQEDSDRIDNGIIPFVPRKEVNVPFTRINHTDVTNSAAIVNTETMTQDFFLASSQDNMILTTSQDANEWLAVGYSIL